MSLSFGLQVSLQVSFTITATWQTPRTAALDVQQVNGIKDEQVAASVLLPHEVLHALATCNAGDFFQTIMFGDLRPQDVSSFWKHIRTLDPWRDHPVLHDPKQDLSTLVGIQLHGDGAEMFRDDEVFVFSWSSVFASSGRETDVMLYRFPVLFVHERHMQKPKVTGCGNMKYSISVSFMTSFMVCCV